MNFSKIKYFNNSMNNKICNLFSLLRLVPGEVIGEYTRYQEKSHKHLYPLKEFTFRKI